MFSWITGPRITNVIEDLQNDPNMDATVVEPPDTPAHQFAVKAFKQAIFGTPAPPDRNLSKRLEKKPITDADPPVPRFPAPREKAAPESPMKNGILMTPGGTARSRKTVSFGAHVVDNEGKKANIGRSGIPNDCPGKFPSPWNPGTALDLDVTSDSKPRSKLTAALYDARSITPKSGQKLKAKDDTDITLDMSAPRSESGKYWKEQYESYAERSEKQMKQLVTKHHVAKTFAKKKDAEATEAATRLADERKRFRNRERELEQQNKDYQERLRKALAETTAASVEISALKSRLAALEKSTVASGLESSKTPFQIYEDANKDSSRLLLEQEKPVEARSHDTKEMPSVIFGKQVQSSRISPEDKENSPPKRHMRSQTLPQASPRPLTPQSAAPTNLAEPKLILEPLPALSLLSHRKAQPSKENLPLRSPAPTAFMPSSPLPVPSPGLGLGADLWMQSDADSPAPPIDRMAFPIANGFTTSRFSRPVANRHRASKSVAHTTTRAVVHKAEHHVPKSEVAESSSHRNLTTDSAHQRTTEAPKATDVTKGSSLNQDRESDAIAKSAVHHFEAPPHMPKTKSQLDSARKAQAKRRLEERKQRRAAA